MIKCARPKRMRFSFESRCRTRLARPRRSEPAGCPRPPALRAAPAATGSGVATRRAAGVRLRDRPPVPRHQPRLLPRELEQRILAAREFAKAGPVIVAGQLGLPASTVWKVLRRYGVSRLRRALPRAVHPLRARAAGRARARRHHEARPLLDSRQAHPRRPARPQPPRRLAVPAPRDRRPLPPRLC